MSGKTTLIHAGAIVDAGSVAAAPGALLLRDGCVMAAGSPESIGDVPEAIFIDRSNAVIVPALANAHAHLDLTHIGPLPYNGDFANWLDRILAEREAIDESGIDQSVTLGAELARAGGTAYIGDIAGSWSTVPVHALRRSTLKGVSYVEVFGLGIRQQSTAASMRRLATDVIHDEGDVSLGISPHAPYTCGMDVYREAVNLGLPVATHLAESLEELQFARTADGPFADLLRKLGVWDDSIASIGNHPVTALAETFNTVPAIAAHLNYVDDDALAALARLKLTVAYCPRASAYFGHPHAEHVQHRYNDMIDAGINVALGTDSMVCLDTPERISVLDDMRLLHQRDDADPQRLLAMATVNGAQALGVDPQVLTFATGPIAGVLAVPGTSLAAALAGNEPPEWVYDGSA